MSDTHVADGDCESKRVLVYGGVRVRVRTRVSVRVRARVRVSHNDVCPIRMQRTAVADRNGSWYGGDKC